jgi:hypothetical protein
MIFKPETAELTTDKPLTTPVDTPGLPKKGLLKKVVDQIHQDSVQRSGEYLEETEVPHGGE